MKNRINLPNRVWWPWLQLKSCSNKRKSFININKQHPQHYKTKWQLWLSVDMSTTSSWWNCLPSFFFREGKRATVHFSARRFVNMTHKGHASSSLLPPCLVFLLLLKPVKKPIHEFFACFALKWRPRAPKRSKLNNSCKTNKLKPRLQVEISIQPRGKACNKGLDEAPENKRSLHQNFSKGPISMD